MPDCRAGQSRVPVPIRPARGVPAVRPGRLPERRGALGSMGSMGHPGIVVANTTPLIDFAEIDRLELLQALFGELLVRGARCRRISRSAIHRNRGMFTSCEAAASDRRGCPADRRTAQQGAILAQFGTDAASASSQFFSDRERKAFHLAERDGYSGRCLHAAYVRRTATQTPLTDCDEPVQLPLTQL